ncbi:hypothetical protein ACLOJK_019686 [Asimina triloba]
MTSSNNPGSFPSNSSCSKCETHQQQNDGENPPNQQGEQNQFHLQTASRILFDMFGRSKISEPKSEAASRGPPPPQPPDHEQPPSIRGSKRGWARTTGNKDSAPN